MNALDKIITWLSPQTGAKRLRARLVVQEAQRLYEGAKTGRRTDGWTTASTSANAEIGPSLTKMRDRGRDLVRNNPYGAKAIRVFQTNTVGCGILPKAQTGDEKLNADIDAAWKEWCKACDADGLKTFYGIQRLAARAIFESGECLIRFRNRRPSDGMEIPLQLQMLEGDFLDATKTGVNGPNIIIQGVEFDPIGARVAYWLFSQHPGDVVTRTSSLLLTSQRVPASEVIHLFNEDRIGQVRGVTSFAAVLMKMRDLDEYDDAELMRKKIEACFAAFVTQEAGEDGPTLGDKSTDSKTGKRLESLEPGMINYLKPGESVDFGTPGGNDNYPAYMDAQLHAVAAGIGQTYEQVTGDLSNVNYSSYRAGQMEFRADIEQFRELMLIPRLCDAVWHRFVETAYLAGKIRKIDYGVKWTPPRFQSIDPSKDTKADITAIRAGLLSLPDAISANGYDPDEQLAEIAATNQKLDELGLILDCDPRKVTGAGQGMQTGDNASKGTADGQNND